MTGAPLKNSLKRSTLMVAEVMMTFRSGRFGQQLPQVAHQKVDIKAAFVGLINNQGIVTIQEPVMLWTSDSRMPSVTTLTRDWSDVVSVKRT